MTYLNYIFLLDGYIFTTIDDEKKRKVNFPSIFERFYLNLRNFFWKFMKFMNKDSYGVWFFSIFRFFSSTMTLDNLNTKKIRVPYEPLLKTFQKSNYAYSEQSLYINSNSHCLDQISCFILIIALSLIRFWVNKTLHEKKNFRLTEICEKNRKDNFFVRFRIFPFHGNIIFSELSYKQKCEKAASFHKCVFLRKYEIFVYDSLR